MSPDSLPIGPLREDEIDALRALAASIWAVSFRDLISPTQIDYMLEQRYAPHQLRAALARGEALLVARAAGTPVAYAHAWMQDATSCKLDKLYVAVERQRQGLGGRLLAAVEDWARARGARELVLRVNKRNHAALAAYRRYGFVTRDALVEDIGGGFVMDDYLLGKTLRSDTADVGRLS